MAYKYSYVFFGKHLSVTSHVLIVLFSINMLLLGIFLFMSALGMIKFGEDYLGGFGWVLVGAFLSISIFTNLHRVKAAKNFLMLISLWFLVYGIFDTIRG